MLNTSKDHFVEPDTVYKKTSKNTVNPVDRNTRAVKKKTVNHVPIHWLFVHWLQNDPRNIEVLCILKCLVNPSLYDALI